MKKIINLKKGIMVSYFNIIKIGIIERLDTQMAI